jgi:cell division transport system permease protein
VRALTYGLGELIHAPLASLMTIAVIGVAMALPMGFYLLLQNAQTLSQSWRGNPTITLYLKQNMADTEIKPVLSQLTHRTDIKQVQYISPDEGLAEFKRESQFGDILNTLSANPLPPVLVITPTAEASSPKALQHLLSTLKTMTAVDMATLDMAWVKRLYYILTLGKRITYTIAGLFGFGVILIIGNTIRLTMQAHRQEMTILKLVGATTAFIRRPLLYRGFLYGFFGGCLAWVLVSLMLWWLAAPAEHLAASYGNHFMINGLNIKTGLEIIVISALLGLLGAWAVVRHHLLAPEVL